MKRILILVFTISCLCVVMFTISSCELLYSLNIDINNTDDEKTSGTGTTADIDNDEKETTGLTFELLSDGTYELSKGNKNVSKIVIPKSYMGKPVTKINKYALRQCTNLTSISIPDSVTLIETYAFYGCTSLKDIVVDENNKTYKSIDGNLYSKDGKTLIQYAIGKSETKFTILDNVVNIENYAFYASQHLTNIFISRSVTNVGEDAFFACPNLTDILTDENNAYYKSIDGNLYSKDGKTLLRYATGKTNSEVTTPNNITRIGNYAFSGCNKIKSITITSNIKNIGDSAFSLCENLITVTIQNGVAYMGTNVFSSCTRLANVSIPDSITIISAYAFRDCSSLSNITIPNSITSIENSAFMGCQKLKTVDIPDSVISIGQHAFSDCYNLTIVTIPDSVMNIGHVAFSVCYNLNIIYCEAESRPEGWENTWNYEGCYVKWGWNMD